MTKIIVALALTASLMACGKKKPAVAPDNTTGNATGTQNTTQGAGAMGGASYGGSSYGSPAPAAP